MNRRILIILFTTNILACTPVERSTSPPEDNYDPSSGSTEVKVPETWISQRVSAAEARLKSTEAGSIVWRAIEAHGGLETWYENGAMAFHFNYQPLDDGTPRNTFQVVDTWRAVARHRLIDQPNIEYGWTGTEAWINPADADIPYNTRFWSLTPYYFVGIPFVLSDEGINYELLPDITYKETGYHVVKVTFDEGTGDAPDDYYILYFDQNSFRLGVIRYIVSYKGYFPDGGHLPEKFMDCEGEQTVEGITLPRNYKTYWSEDGGPGEHITNIELTEVSFQPDQTRAYFFVPEGAKVLEGY